MVKLSCSRTVVEERIEIEMPGEWPPVPVTLLLLPSGRYELRGEPKAGWWTGQVLAESRDEAEVLVGELAALLRDLAQALTASEPARREVRAREEALRAWEAEDR